jgi:hypothetical protein
VSRLAEINLEPLGAHQYSKSTSIPISNLPANSLETRHFALKKRESAMAWAIAGLRVRTPTPLTCTDASSQSWPASGVVSIA